MYKSMIIMTVMVNILFSVIYQAQISYPCKNIISENTRVNSVETSLGSMLYFFMYSRSSTLDPLMTFAAMLITHNKIAMETNTYIPCT